MDFKTTSNVANEFIFNFTKTPDSCPKCHHAISPVYKHGITISKVENKSPKYTQIVLFCPNCEELFIAKYTNITTKGGGKWSGNLDLKEPIYPLDTIVDEDIKEISPTFCETYNQALAAQSYSLHQIVGIGLRKSLEFLIKDYLCHKDPDNSEKYRSWRLGKCIKDGITDPSLQVVANRAVWLGNDETHYLKKWEGKDIEDLKVLTAITMNHIKNSILALKYEEEMPG